MNVNFVRFYRLSNYEENFGFNTLYFQNFKKFYIQEQILHSYFLRFENPYFFQFL